MGVLGVIILIYAARYMQPPSSAWGGIVVGLCLAAGGFVGGLESERTAEQRTVAQAYFGGERMRVQPRSEQSAQVTREIWIRCPHCRQKYEESHGLCPHCGAPAP